MTTESIDYPEQMRRDREEIARLRAKRDQLLAASKEVISWQMDENFKPPEIRGAWLRLCAAIAAVEEKP
jgi:hypothetical protein